MLKKAIQLCVCIFVTSLVVPAHSDTHPGGSLPKPQGFAGHAGVDLSLLPPPPSPALDPSKGQVAGTRQGPMYHDGPSGQP